MPNASDFSDEDYYNPLDSQGTKQDAARILAEDPEFSAEKFYYCTDKMFAHKDILPVVQADEPTHKPKAFWLSTGGDMGWFTWCIYEMPSWLPDYIYEVQVNLPSPGANSGLVRLDTKEDAVNFTNTFKDTTAQSFFTAIDWKKVAQQYPIGIYVEDPRTLRYYANWLETWDVTSLALWNPKVAIQDMTPAYQYNKETNTYDKRS
jgi:hypothetical protein